LIILILFFLYLVIIIPIVLIVLNLISKEITPFFNRINNTIYQKINKIGKREILEYKKTNNNLAIFYRNKAIELFNILEIDKEYKTSTHLISWFEYAQRKGIIMYTAKKSKKKRIILVAYKLQGFKKACKINKKQFYKIKFYILG